MDHVSAPLTPVHARDPLLGVVCGLWAALLLVAPVATLVGRVLAPSGATLYGTVVATLFVVTTLVGWVASRRAPAIAVSLGGTWWRWGPAIVAGAYGVIAYLTLHGTGAFGVIAFFFGLLAIGPGWVLSLMAGTRYADAATDGTETYCECRAGWPAAAQRRHLLLVSPVLLIGTVGTLSTYIGPDSHLLAVAQLLLPVGIGLVSLTTEREYAVTAAGLVQTHPLARQLYPWETFVGYSRTDDALILHQPRRFDIRLSLAALDDPDGVEDALSRHLGDS